MRFVKGVKYLKEHELSVTFGDGSKAHVNLRPYLHGEIFRALRKIHYFKKVSVNRDIDTICWPNGADFSPEFLHQIGKKFRSNS